MAYSRTFNKQCALPLAVNRQVQSAAERTELRGVLSVHPRKRANAAEHGAPRPRWRRDSATFPDTWLGFQRPDSVDMARSVCQIGTGICADVPLRRVAGRPTPIAFVTPTGWSQRHHPRLDSSQILT